MTERSQTRSIKRQHRALFTGTRVPTSDLRTTVERCLKILQSRHGDDLFIVVGDCPTGADAEVVRACKALEIKYKSFKANWQTYGKAAGPLRNAAMVNSIVMECYAFPHREYVNKGTRNCMQLARDSQIPVHVQTVG